MKITKSRLREIVKEEIDDMTRKKMYNTHRAYHKEWALVEYDINEAVLNIFFRLTNRGSGPGKMQISFRAAVGMDPIKHGAAAALSYVGIKSDLRPIEIDLTEEQEELLANALSGDRKSAVMKILRDTRNMDIFKMIERELEKNRLVTIKKKSWR